MSFYCEWLQVTSGITTKRVRGGMSAQLGHWQDWMFVHFLLTVPLCNFLFLAPDLVLSPHCSSSPFSFVLPTGTLPFPSPPTELFHTLLLCPSAAAAFLSLSRDIPTSHPILLQIWGFDINLALTFSKMFLMKAYTVVLAMLCTYFTLRGWNQGVEESLVNLARVWFSWCPQADPPDLLHPLAVSSGHCLIWGSS